jgi:predicted ester cyclase
MKTWLTICILSCLMIQRARGQSDNEKVALFYINEVVNNRKLNLLNQVFADTFIRHDLLDNSQRILTVEQQKQALESLFKALPDLHYTIGDIISEGDRVAIRLILQATHRGEFFGYEPTGNHINYLSEIFFLRFENKKIVERWNQFDLYNLFKHLKNDSAKKVAQVYIEDVINKKKLDLLPVVFSENYTFHEANGMESNHMKNGTLAPFLTTLFKAFPDLHYTIDFSVEEADKLVIYCTATGTHQAEFLGIAAVGNKVTFKEIFIFRIKNNKVVEGWGLVDVLGLEQQMRGK